MKTVVITGISKGIGLATAQKFLMEGWRVTGTYLNAPPPIEHERLTVVRYDQGDSASVANIVESVTASADRIDALINNAGVLLDPNDTWADPVKVRKTLEINVVGVIDFTEHLLPLFDKESCIVNLSSGYGVITPGV